MIQFSKMGKCHRVMWCWLLLLLTLCFLPGCSLAGQSGSGSDGSSDFLCISSKVIEENEANSTVEYYEYDESGNLVREISRHLIDTGYYSETIRTYTEEGYESLREDIRYRDDGTVYSYISNEREYDDHGNATWQLVLQGDSKAEATPMNDPARIDYEYGSDGSEQWVRYSGDTYVSSGEVRYDSKGNKTYEFIQDDEGQSKTVEYRYSGNQLIGESVVETDKDGETSSYELVNHIDESGNVVFSTAADPADSGDCPFPGDGIYFAYDENGNKVQRVLISEGAVSSVHSYVYDDYGNLLVDLLDTSAERTITTYDYMKKDGSLYVSGSEYDSRKFFAPYADNHPMRNRLLVDVEAVYEKYGTSGEFSAYLGDCKIGYSEGEEDLLNFDPSIKCTQSSSENLLIATSEYEYELPSSWVGHVQVDYSGPLMDECTVSYLAKDTKEKITVLYSDFNEIEKGLDPSSVPGKQPIWYLVDSDAGRCVSFESFASRVLWNWLTYPDVESYVKLSEEDERVLYALCFGDSFDAEAIAKSGVEATDADFSATTWLPLVQKTAKWLG